MDLGYYNSYLEVDLNAIRDNYFKVRRHIGPEHDFIPVVKANAYGMGTAAIAKLLAEECQVKLVGCAQIIEGVRIREAGIEDMDILIMGAAPDYAVPYAVTYRLQLPLFNQETARLLSQAAKDHGCRVKAQIKIETGLNRIGVKPGQPLAELLDCVKELGNIEIAGAFTHFATSINYEDPFTYEQYDKFQQGVKQIQDAGVSLQYIHCCNSGGTVWFKKGYGTHVRNGSLYLGYSDMADHSNPVGVKEAASWRAFITNIHEVLPGESVGYSRYFQPEKPTMVATVDIGYGDGFYRPLAMDFGPVLVNDTRTRYLGICMDQLFVDVTGIDCKLFDEVTILGYSRGGALLSALEISDFIHHTHLYPLCSIGDRVKRVYIR